MKVSLFLHKIVTEYEIIAKISKILRNESRAKGLSIPGEKKTEHENLVLHSL